MGVDKHVVIHPDIAQNPRKGADLYAIAKGRVALALWIFADAAGAKDDGVQDIAIVADDGGRANDRIGAVIQHKAPPDPRRRMDFGPRQDAAKMADRHGDAPLFGAVMALPYGMGDPVAQGRDKGRVRGQHQQGLAQNGRIPFDMRCKILADVVDDFALKGHGAIGHIIRHGAPRLGWPGIAEQGFEHFADQILHTNIHSASTCRCMPLTIVWVNERNVCNTIIGGTMWVPKLETGFSKPEALVRALKRAIESGELKVNDRLPAQRELAYALGLNLSTVSRAMVEATRQGLVGGEVGRGTYVLPRSDAAQLFSQISQTCSSLDLATILPPLVDEAVLRSAFTATADLTPHLFGYPTDAQLYRATDAVRQWMRWRGFDLPRADVAITTGAQAALSAVLAALLKPGKTLMTEAFTFPGMKAVAQQSGLRLHGVACDREGLLPDALEQASAQTGARVLVAMPNLQNPTGAVMSPGRRADIAGVIRRAGLTLVEDDVYGSYSGQPPLVADLEGQHVLISSLSKSVSPALRFGFAIGNHPVLDRIRKEAATASWFVAPLPMMTATRMIEDRSAMRLASQQTEEIARRWCIVTRFFPGLAAAPACHFWLPVAESRPSNRAPCHWAFVSCRTISSPRQDSAAAMCACRSAPSHGTGC